MSVQPFQRPLSLDEAVDRVFAAALEGQAVIDAATEFAHQVDDRDVLDAVRIALAELAHRRLGQQRRGKAEVATANAEESGRPRAKANPSRARGVLTVLAALDGNYEGADGTRKSLRRFTLDDWLHLRTQAAGKVDGWIRVRDASDRAVSAMRQHNVKTTADLPIEEQRAINGRLA